MKIFQNLLAIIGKNLPLFHPKRLYDYGSNNKHNAKPEWPVKLLQFIEDEGRKSNAVNGFQIVNEVYRESGDPTERMQLQEER